MIILNNKFKKNPQLNRTTFFRHLTQEYFNKIFRQKLRDQSNLLHKNKFL